MSGQNSCHLIADFTIDNLAAHLRNADPSIEVVVSPFGQVVQELSAMAALDERRDFVVVWTLPERAIPSFNALVHFEAHGPDVLKRILDEVDEFSNRIRAVHEKAKRVFVPSWVANPQAPVPGSLAMRPGVGAAHAIMRMNVRLAENLEDLPNLSVLDAQKWVMNAGRDGSNPKLWYAAKIPFGNAVYRQAAADIYAAIQASKGLSRKLLVLDLDDTLWGGTVGEVGWEHIRLGGHDYIGEAFVDFQRALKTLSKRGILLGIVSKNDETVALDAIRQHSAMVLNTSDFAGWRINWSDKAENLRALVSDLSLGLDSVVFIDDNPAERSRVKEALPDVLVPDWPVDPTAYRTRLAELTCFDTLAITQEDVNRTSSYASERERVALKGATTSLDEWLETLDIRVTVEPLAGRNLPRAVQLLNKTNQMNLTTRRLSESEVSEEVESRKSMFWVFSLADRLGDSGLIGVASLRAPEGKNARIQDFILSCRVMGRKVEQVMIRALVDQARAMGSDTLLAEYIPTSKNKPCLRFFHESSGFEQVDERLFAWPVSREYEVPAYVRVVDGR